MTNPPKLKLLERSRGDGFASARSFIPGQSILGELRPGSQVSLRDEKKVEILVVVTAIDGEVLTGEIEDFTGHGPTYLGMSLGDSITFREANVFIST
jgi:hypothetical protein